MQLETPIIIEKKLEEYAKLAAVGKAIDALIEAYKLNDHMPIEDLSEVITAMAIRRIRKDMPAYKHK